MPAALAAWADRATRKGARQPIPVLMANGPVPQADPGSARGRCFDFQKIPGYFIVTNIYMAGEKAAM
jgi:hypothetical protein